MTNIVLLNVYGQKNIGDEAINQIALTLVKKAFGKEAIITSVCVDVNSSLSFSKKLELNIRKNISPYGYAINEGGSKLSAVEKLFRSFTVIICSLFFTIVGKFSQSLLPSRGTYAYIKSLKNADLVLNMGGGYLRTKNKYRDFFGLTTTLLPIFIAKIFTKSMIFLPMSFGNFASDLHQRIAFLGLTRSIFFARDEITFKQVEKMAKSQQKKIDLSYSPDLALLTKYKVLHDLKEKENSQYIVISGREWLGGDKQTKYEQDLARLIDYIFVTYGLRILFVAMASNSIEDDDRQVAKRIKKYLQHKKSFELMNAGDPRDVLELIDGARIAICTRMHSAILSSLAETPFITIQYEHKTLGFMKSLSLADLNLDIHQLSYAQLEKKVDILLKKKDMYHKVVGILKNKKKEYAKYEELLISCLKQKAHN